MTPPNVRPAAMVAVEICGCATPDQRKRAITAIEADRQATRAALVSEIVVWLRVDRGGLQPIINDYADKISAKWGK